MLEKQKIRRPTAERATGKKRVFRKRRRAGFYAFFALVVVALSTSKLTLKLHGP